ncbi:MAG: hypothetical protein AB7S38_33895 [Vulcanimicrobiota bacterium]
MIISHRATQAKKPLPDPLKGMSAEVRQAVTASVGATASYKGYPWSQTEYNMSMYMARERIEEEHGPEAAKAFETLMGREPVRGGRFNPWSGD